MRNRGAYVCTRLIVDGPSPLLPQSSLQKEGGGGAYDTFNVVQ